MHILSLFSIVVNYDNDNGWTTFLDKIKSTPKITKKVEKALEALKDVKIENIKTAEQLGKRVGYTNEEFFKFAKQADLSGDALDQYKTYMQSASTATSKLGAALKSVAANIGIMLAINIAIKAASAVWDAWNVTVEESQEKIDNINSRIEELNSNLSELRDKQDKTSVDNQRIEQLEQELDLQERLLEIEQKRLYQNQIGTSFSDYFDADSLVAKKSVEENRYNKEGYEYLSSNYDKNVTILQELNEKIAHLTNSYNNTDVESERINIMESINSAIEKRTKLLEDQISIEEQLTLNSVEYLQNYQTAQEAIDSGLLTGDDLKKAQEMSEYWGQMYNDTQGIITNIQKATGTYDESKNIESRLSGILSKADFQETTKQLEELGKNGELSVATLSSKFPELIEYLDKAGISAQELYQYIMALADPDAINYDGVRKQLMDSLGFGISIDSASEAQIWNEISKLDDEELILEAYLRVSDQYGIHPEGWNATDWLAHIQSELEVQELEVKAQLSILETVDELNTKLKPAMDTLKSAWEDIFTDDGFTLENIGIDMLASIKKEIDELNEIDGISIDYSSFEKLARVLTDTSSTAEDVQNQFNELASTIVYATGTAEVNSDTFDVLVKSMEEMGLVNAREVLIEMIELEKEFQAVSEDLGFTIQDVTNATYEETVQMLIEAQAAGKDTTALFQLAATKGKITDGTIETESNVEALLAEAQAAGLDVATLTALENVRNGNIKDTNAAAAIMENARQQILDAMSGFELDFDFGNIGGGSKVAGSAGKAAGDEYVSQFEKSLQELEELRDSGKITEKEYLDQLRRLYEKYFKDRKKYLKEYQKYENQYLQGRHTCPLLQ